MKLAFVIPEVDLDVLRCEVRKEYAEVANFPAKGFHFHTGRPLAHLLGYEPAWLEAVPERSLESFAGTGNPFLARPIAAGERVVDVGCGAGIDSLIAGAMAGSGGSVVGIDMTPEMLDKALASAAERGFGRLAFHRGHAESLPVADGWADVVISNGVVNLCPDKPQVFREMYRALRPGGRIQIGDIVVQRSVPESAKRDINLWKG